MILGNGMQHNAMVLLCGHLSPASQCAAGGPQVHELEAEQQHWREMYREAAAAQSNVPTPGRHTPAQLPVSRSASHLSSEAPPGALQPQPGRLGRAGEGGGRGYRSPAASPGGVVVAAEEGSEEDVEVDSMPPGDLDGLDGLIRHAAQD